MGLVHGLLQSMNVKIFSILVVEHGQCGLTAVIPIRLLAIRESRL